LKLFYPIKVGMKDRYVTYMQVKWIIEKKKSVVRFKQTKLLENLLLKFPLLTCCLLVGMHRCQLGIGPDSVLVYFHFHIKMLPDQQLTYYAECTEQSL